jgi:predicted AAA+ superfamily ATPase
VTVELLGLTQREIHARTAERDWLDIVTAGELDEVRLPCDPPDLADYVSAILTSGFPEAALRLQPSLRQAWLEAYLDHVVHREVGPLENRRDPVRLRRWIQATALLTAGTPNLSTLTDAAGVDRRTGQAYDDVLIRLYLLELLPAWHSNRLSRLTSQPKRHVLDTALAATAAGLAAGDILRDGGLLGSLLESFVIAQLQPEANLRTPKARLHHLRSQGGTTEVDIVVDLGAGRVVCIEVKASGAVQQRDARHLKTLRTALGDRFLRGVVLHTGPYAYELDDRIWALPIASFWG